MRAPGSVEIQDPIQGLAVRVDLCYAFVEVRILDRNITIYHYSRALCRQQHHKQARIFAADKL